MYIITPLASGYKIRSFWEKKGFVRLFVLSSKHFFFRFSLSAMACWYLQMPFLCTEIYSSPAHVSPGTCMTSVYVLPKNPLSSTTRWDHQKWRHMRSTHYFDSDIEISLTPSQPTLHNPMGQYEIYITHQSKWDIYLTYLPIGDTDQARDLNSCGGWGLYGKFRIFPQRSHSQLYSSIINVGKDKHLK